MFMTRSIFLFFSLFISFSQCKKEEIQAATSFELLSIQYHNKISGSTIFLEEQQPSISFLFNHKLDKNTTQKAIVFRSTKAIDIPFTFSFDHNDSALIISPTQNLETLSKYYLVLTNDLQNSQKTKLKNNINLELFSFIDTSKTAFPNISDDSLLTLIQKQTFRYFWDFGHPVSGLSRERNSSGNICTSGGSGFGIMSILVAINNGFISRSEGIQRIKTILDFLKNKTKKYHGAFPHWFNGADGSTIPFSSYDDGGDLVETSYLMMGLLCARQFFNGASTDEKLIQDQVNLLYKNVEWSYYQNGQDVLFWHWSENYAWKMNHRIQGWNEALITYILAASSPTFPIPASVYKNGWAKNGGIKNGRSFFNYTLPLGEDYGGPLFFSHYTFLGVDPNGLKDEYADYSIQVKNHSLINYEYCKSKTNITFGYSDQCWGLTASDTYNGYTAHSPTNDKGVISPTAAISSLPFTHEESMKAIRYFYFILGEKLWKEYGFIDAFSLEKNWFADSFLAIDQGPIIVMIENHKSKLLWNLFTSCPEVNDGMKKLGFTAPYIK